MNSELAFSDVDEGYHNVVLKQSLLEDLISYSPVSYFFN